MPKKLPVSYDISQFIEKIRKTKEGKPTAQALNDLLDVSSAHGDLLFARAILLAVTTAIEHENDDDSPYSMPVRGALLAQAILLYARATITRSARKTFNIRSKLNEDQKEVHQLISNYRNEAIAHFDRKSRHDDGFWADERVILVPSIPLEQGPVRPALRRTVTQPKVLQQIITQVDVVLPIYMELIKEKIRISNDKLDNYIRKNNEAAAILLNDRFDPISFFDNLERAEDFLGSGRMQGTLHGVIARD